MDNFDEIIKQKLEQFDVPYNEAHWTEMDQKLNSIRAAKIKKNIFGSAAIIAVVAISGYFILSDNETIINETIIAEDNTSEIIVDDNAIEPVKEENALPNDNFVKEEVTNDNASEENETEGEIEKNDVKKKVEVDKPVKNIKENNGSSDKVNPTNTLVNSEFIVYNNKVCLGETVSFESMENDHPVSYTWNFGDGTISHKTNPKHVYKDSHTYTVSLTLLNRQTGKEHTTILEDVVTILPSPKVGFSYVETSVKHNDNKFKYPYTTFKVKNPIKQNTYRWNFGNGETSTAVNAKTIYKEKGKNYSATLIVENIQGCINSSTVKVVNKNEMDLFAQNGIKPNSNIAENKVFIPGALLGWDIRFEMTIINKSGKVIYQTSDKTEPWNGKMNNTGQVLNEGVYLWQVVTYDASGAPHTQHGKINLIK